VALNAGLTSSDPLVARRIEETAAFLEHCERTKPWEDESLHGQKRHTKFGYMRKIPGMLAQVAPVHAIVQKYRECANSLLQSHSAADDFSVDHEDRVWQSVYGEDLASRRFLKAWREYDFWDTHHSLVFDWQVFRLLGHVSVQLEDDLRERYYRMTVGSNPLRGLCFDWGWDQWMANIINRDFANPAFLAPARFSQVVSIQFDALDDMRAYPYWRTTAAPFVEWVLNQRRPDGLWDFGTPHNGFGCATRMRISESWRGKSRALDWSTHVLLLLRHYAEA